MSFRTRVAALVALAVAAAFLVASLVMFGSTRRALLSAVDEQLLEAVGRTPDANTGPLRDLLAAANGGRPGAGGRVPVRGPAGDPLRGIGIVQALAADGRVVATVPAGIDELPVDDDALATAMARGRSPAHTIRTDDASWRVIVARAGQGALQIARPIDDIEQGLRGLAVRLALVSLLGIGFAAAAGRLVANRVLRPVRVLTETAELIARTQELAHRADVEGDDELARLGRSLNGMLAALDTSRRAQQQLVADASHELRTPLTSLRTNVEMLASPSGQLTAADRAAMRDDIVGQIEEMTLLVGNLVDLARDGAERLERVPVALDELVEGVVERQRRLHPDVVIDLRSTSVLVQGDADRLTRAVANLVDNAVKYAGVAGPIEVEVGPGGVRVRDHGPGVAPLDRARVFDRFWRAARDRGAAGSGLGLAIVAQVAAAHGGTVTVHEAPGGGAEFHLALPT